MKFFIYLFINCFFLYYRLKRPSECPEDIYDNLMMACWHDEPQRRPNFTQLLIEIRKLISEYGESI